jgi:hypothetical protein
MVDTKALGQRRRGRRPKPNKRVPLSLLVDPELRSRIIDSAEENGRSITRQTELMLKQSIKLLSLDDGPIATLNMPRVLVGERGLSGSENSNPDKKDFRQINRTTTLASTIAARAGVFLDAHYPGRSKDERIARDFGISAGMAKLLRQGRAWTVARLDQALELWPEFRGVIFAERDGEQINRLQQLAAGLAQLADEVAQLRQELRSERARDWPGVDRTKHGTGVTKLKVGDCGGYQWHCEHDRIEE